MTTKRYVTISFIALLACAFSPGIKLCSADKLYGEWVFIKLYPARVTTIDTLKTEPDKSRFGTPNQTFRKTGTYINSQGDYETTGNFTVDKVNCLLKTFDDNGKKGDTSVFEIAYLDNSHLLLVDNSGKYFRTYFYKRK